MKKIVVVLSVLLEASLVPCVAGTVTNAYYRAELETCGGVTRLAGLVKVQKGGDVCVPGTWTVLGGPESVAFENGRIVVRPCRAFHFAHARHRRDAPLRSGPRKLGLSGA